MVTRIEGAPLPDVLEARLFDPLAMKDPGFTVLPALPEKRHRRAASHGFDVRDTIIKLDGILDGAALPERPDDTEFVSGGRGLWSTLDDYLAFARMFVGRGSVDRVVLLRARRWRVK